MAIKHGMYGTRFYRIWGSMKVRCRTGDGKMYPGYNEKGIKVCERWRDFTNFKSDMYVDYLNHVKEHGEADTTIDRIDTDGNYEPSNCRWATRLEQTRNRNPFIVKGGSQKYKYIYEGVPYANIKMLVELLGIPLTTLKRRMKNKQIDIEKVAK